MNRIEHSSLELVAGALGFAMCYDPTRAKIPSMGLSRHWRISERSKIDRIPYGGIPPEQGLQIVEAERRSRLSGLQSLQTSGFGMEKSGCGENVGNINQIYVVKII
jgi:hypothetical protein